MDGNYSTAGNDWLGMDCTHIRDALSALLDGEDPTIVEDEIDLHLDGCRDCTRWYTGIAALDRRLRVRAADEVPDLSGAIALRVRAEPHSHWWQPAWPWRVTLALVGLAQVLQGLYGTLLEASGADHLTHELGAWTVALGAGFLYAAWRPSKAAGLLPFVGALVVCLLVASTRDAIVGAAGPVDEVIHLFEVVGLLLLAGVARYGRSPNPRSWSGRVAAV
jgi:predicted anti-sigma-YlaC factor YlaD